MKEKFRFPFTSWYYSNPLKSIHLFYFPCHTMVATSANDNSFLSDSEGRLHRLDSLILYGSKRLRVWNDSLFARPFTVHCSVVDANLPYIRMVGSLN